RCATEKYFPAPVAARRRPEGLKARAHAGRSAGTLGRLRRHSAKTSNREISPANRRFVNDQNYINIISVFPCTADAIRADFEKLFYTILRILYTQTCVDIFMKCRPM